MKKIIYILLIAFSTSMAITSCTEDEVVPTNTSENTGGQGGNATGLLSTSASGSGWGGRTGGVPGGTYDIGIPGATTGQCAFGSGPVLYYTDGLSGYASGGPYGQKAETTRAGRPSGIGTENSLAGLGYGSGARGTVTIASDIARSGADGSAGICIIRLIY
jgi:hypothetical protein